MGGITGARGLHLLTCKSGVCGCIYVCGCSELWFECVLSVSLCDGGVFTLSMLRRNAMHAYVCVITIDPMYVYVYVRVGVGVGADNHIQAGRSRQRPVFTGRSVLCRGRGAVPKDRRPQGL